MNCAHCVPKRHQSPSRDNSYASFLATNTATDCQHTEAPRQHAAPHDLRIQVPCLPCPPALEGPFQFNDTTSSLPDFTSLTQLPTPVLAPGTFGGLTSGPLDVPKPRIATTAPARARVVSAFDAEQRLSPVLPTAQVHARHVSNPAAPMTGSAWLLPLPPQDEALEAPKGCVLHAPTLNRTFVCEEVVGAGAFSTVLRARDTADPDVEVAVKTVRFPHDGTTSVSSFRAFVVRELALLAHLRHPCVATLLDYSVNPPVSHAQMRDFLDGAAAPDEENMLSETARAPQHFFLAFCRGGNLFLWLMTNYRAASSTLGFWRLMARVVAEIIVAVAYMHRHQIVHRDIKLENVLLNETPNLAAADPRLLRAPVATITDFGLSKRLTLPDQRLSTKCGSQDYVSPELLMGLEYSGQLLDAWAIGVLVYSIVENRLPFDLPSPELAQLAGVSPSVRRRKSRHSAPHRIAMIDWGWYRGSALILDPDLDPEARQIVRDLQALVDALLVRKEKRLSVEQVLDRFTWVKASVPTEFYK